MSNSDKKEAPPASKPPSTTAPIAVLLSIEKTIKSARYPTKTCKYSGVTYRSSREKFQARIYKGNKEYNLGLFELATDAALAYDTTHRLIKHIADVASANDNKGHHTTKTTSTTTNSDMQALRHYEDTADTIPHWIDLSENDALSANNNIDPTKLNFIIPSTYKAERTKELDESRLLLNYNEHNINAAPPCIDTVKAVVLKEAIRVANMIIGVVDCGTGNYRIRRGSRKPYEDGTLIPLDAASKKMKKKKRRSEPVDNMLQRQQQQHNNNGLVGVSINPAMYMMPHQGMYPQQGMQPNMDSNNNVIEMGKAPDGSMMPVLLL